MFHYKYDSRVLGCFQVGSESLGSASGTFSCKVRSAQPRFFLCSTSAPQERIPNQQRSFFKKTLICIKMGSSTFPSPSKWAVSYWKPHRAVHPKVVRFLVLKQWKFLDDSCQSRPERDPALPETWWRQIWPPAETREIIIRTRLSRQCNCFQITFPVFWSSQGFLFIHQLYLHNIIFPTGNANCFPQTSS